MNLTRRDEAPAAAGAARPLPLPQEGDGRAAPLPTPRAGDSETVTLPLPPARSSERDGVTGPAKRGIVITRRALNFFLDRAETHFVRFSNMDAAAKRAARDLKDRIEHAEGIFDLKPPTALERYLTTWAKRNLATEEPPGVAARRRDWDEAKRSGDAGAMTRTANALLRAVEEAGGHLDRHAAAHAAGQDGARHPTSEILNPSARTKNAGSETPPDTHEWRSSKGRSVRWTNEKSALPHLTADGEIILPDGGRTPGSDDDMPPGETARSSAAEADSNLATGLTAGQLKAAAKAISYAAPGQRALMLDLLHDRFGDDIHGRVLAYLPPEMFERITARRSGLRIPHANDGKHGGPTTTSLPSIANIERDNGNERGRARSLAFETSRSPDLPEVSPSELKDDPPIRVEWPAQPPEIPGRLNGKVCVRGSCEDASDRNETDRAMSPELRLFELRIIKKLYGPKATRAWMKQNRLSYHAYHNTTRFRAPPGTTLAQVNEMLRLWAAPQSNYKRPERDRPVVSGDESELHVDYDVLFWFMEWLGLEVPIRGGMVTHYVDEGSGALANVTQPDHALHPGYILRWVEQLPDGTFVIQTLGRGLGGHARVIEVAGARMFTEVDDAVVRDLGGTVLG